MRTKPKVLAIGKPKVLAKRSVAKGWYEKDDARHIAIAVFYELDGLLSWRLQADFTSNFGADKEIKSQISLS